MNYVHLRGRLTADPDLKEVTTKSGEVIHVTRFSLAVNEFQRPTQFIDCVAWRRLAETIINHLKKGSEIILTGKLTMSTEQQSDNTWKKYAEVVAARVEFVGRKPEEEGILVAEDEAVVVS